MATGYEVGMYRDIERIRQALEMIADVMRAQYLETHLGLVATEARGKDQEALDRLENRIRGPR